MGNGEFAGRNLRRNRKARRWQKKPWKKSPWVKSKFDPLRELRKPRNRVEEKGLEQNSLTPESSSAS